MPAAAMPLIGAGVSAGAGLLGAGKQAQQQQQSSNAASQAFGAEEQMISQLMNNYFQQAPGLEAAFKKQAGLENNVGNQLMNFKSVMGPEIQKEANSFANSNKSLLSSLRAGMGGQEMANPGLVLGNMAGQAQQSDMQNSQALGAQLGAQSLTALGEASNAYGQGTSALGDLSSFISGPLGSAMSGLQGIGSIYANEAGRGGNPWTGAMGGLGNFLGMLGQDSGATGVQGVQAAALAGLGASEAEQPPQITGDPYGQYLPNSPTSTPNPFGG